MTTVMKTKECEVELGRPKGSITFSVSGIESKKGFTSLGSVVIGDTISGSGWSFDLFSNVLYSDTDGTPTTYTQASVKKALKIKKRVYALQFSVYSTSADTDFTILGLQAKGRLLRKRPPSSWLN